MTATQKHAEYLQAQSAGDVILAAELWHQFLSLVEAEMLAKEANEREINLLLSQAG